MLSDAAGKRALFSFEFFPPKNPEGEAVLYKTIGDLREVAPDYVSVTYGAGGSTRAKTLEWVSTIQERYGICAMAHFTCVGASRADITASLKDLYDAGIRNIMALRGDPPKGTAEFVPAPDGLRYANELIAFIKSTKYDFSLGGGCYPEVHPEAASADADIANLKRKVDAGAEFLVTQLFFDNKVYFKFVEQCRRVGINVPIVPGIMPITQLKQIERFTQMAGCAIPPALVEDLNAAKNPEDLLRASIEHSARQCIELLEKGAPGLHFYTLNQSHATKEILKAVRATGVPGGR